MDYFSSPGRRLPAPHRLASWLVLLLLLLGRHLAQAQCAPYLYLEKTSQGGVSCNCSSTYRLKASNNDGSGYFTFKLQSNGFLYTVNNQPDSEGYSTLISNLVGPTSYEVTVNYYGRTCSGTTTQTIVIPGDTPGSGGGGSNPGQEEAFFSSPSRTGSVPERASLGATEQALRGGAAYPNPASDQLLVPVSPQAVGGTLLLLDMSGRIVRQVSVRDAQGVRLDTRELAAGLYQLRIPGAAGKAQAIHIQH